MPSVTPIPLHTPIPRHNLTTTIASTATHAARANANPAPQIMFFSPDLLNFLLIGIGIFLAIVISGTIIALKMYGSPSGGGRGGSVVTKKCDLYAVNISSSRREIDIVCCEKLDDNVYIAETEPPKLLIVPSQEPIFRIRVGKTEKPAIPTISYQIAMIPLDPEILASLTLALSTDIGAQVDQSSASKALRDLWNLGERKYGKIRVGKITEIGVHINGMKIVEEIVTRVLRGLTTTIWHYFDTTRNEKVFSRYIQALSRYAEAKKSWLIYIPAIVLGIAIAIAIVMLVH